MLATALKPGRHEKMTNKVRPAPQPKVFNSRGRPKLGPNRCAHCEQEGHWEKDCPILSQDPGHSKAN